jgi:predicted DNA-binding protein
MLTTINFRINENQKEQLQTLADDSGENISNVLRKIIEIYLEDLKHYESKSKWENNNVEIIYLDCEEPHSSDDDIEYIELD